MTHDYQRGGTTTLFAEAAPAFHLASHPHKLSLQLDAGTDVAINPVDKQRATEQRAERAVIIDPVNGIEAKVNKKEPERRWISSAEVLKLATRHIGINYLAEFELNRLASSGRLKGKAKLCTLELDFMPIVLDGRKVSSQIIPDLNENFANHGKINLNCISIPDTHWNFETRSLFDSNLWKWEKGVFAFLERPVRKIIQEEGVDGATMPVPMRYVYYHVQFDKDQALSEIKLIRTRYRRRPDWKAGRPKWMFGKPLRQLQDMLMNGHISTKFGDPFDHGVQAKIERFIIDELKTAEDEPSVASARRRAKGFLDQWRQHGSPND